MAEYRIGMRLDAVLPVADGLLHPPASFLIRVHGHQPGPLQAVLIETGFQRRHRAQDADARAFPAQGPDVAHNGIDHMDKAYGPP